jgi:exonuclease III
MRIVSWNINKLPGAWQVLAADPSVDVALLQEATPPPPDFVGLVTPDRDSEWRMAGYTRVFRTAIAGLSSRVTLRERRTTSLDAADSGALKVSRHGTLAVADVTFGGESLTCVSAYATWENALHDPPLAKPEIFADASCHRLISDISALMPGARHRVLVAGDFNILHGYGEDGNAYWGRRYASVFARMEALGLRYVGPRAPNGRQADPWPAELPRESTNVPTYRSTRQTPATATRQLDFVFVSESLAERVSVHAMNGIDEWGPSDHCQIVIDVAER